MDIQEPIDHDQAYRPFLSSRAKKMLTDALFKTEIENKQLDVKKDRYFKIRQKLIESVLNSQRNNIEELTIENKMLQETVEKYRKLYFSLCNLNQDTNANYTDCTDYVLDTKNDSIFEGSEGPDIKSFFIKLEINEHECIEA